MEFTARVLQLLSAGLLTLILVGLVLWKYRKRRIARVLAICASCYAGYSWLAAGLAGAQSAQVAGLWYQYLMPAAYFLVASVYHFCMVFSRTENKYTVAYLRFAYGLAGLLAVARVLQIDGGAIEYRPGPGWFPAPAAYYKFIYGPFLLISILGGLVLIIRRMIKTETAQERNKLWFFFVAIGGALACDTASFIPRAAFLSAFSPLVFTGILSYAITRQRLFDLSLAVTRGPLAAGISFLLVVSLVALILKVQDLVVIRQLGFGPFAILSTALLVSILLPLLLSQVSRAVNRLLGVRTASLEQRLLEYSSLLDKYLSPSDYLSATLEKLVAEMGASTATFLLKDRSSGRLVSAAASEPGQEQLVLEAGSPLAGELAARPHPVDVEVLQSAFDEDVVDGLDGPSRKAIVAEMARLKAGVALPMLVEGRFEGVLLLGGKTSDSIYSDRELEFLQSLCMQVAKALENTRLHEQVQQADRLSTLGTLSASLAHEIRNPLTSISTFVQMLPVRHGDEGFREKFGRIVGQEIAKLTRLTEQLLSFAKPTNSGRAPIDLYGLCEKVRQLLRYQFSKKGVSLEMQGSDGELVVSANEAELSQVLINILLNALQATPQGGGVTLRCAAVEGQAVVSISDTGCGMNPEQIGRIFDPFFTTKADGTGLGLPTCQRVVEQHQGRIEVESRPGAGSVFKISLPQARLTASLAA